METVVADVNGSGIPVVAIDLPSGLSADSHEPIGDSIEAGMTVTLAAPKLSLVLPPAETRAGDIVIADIGIPHDVIQSLDGPRVDLLTRCVDARAHHAAVGRHAQGRLRPRAGRRRVARARPARRIWPASARCDRAPAWSRRDAGLLPCRSSRRWRPST